MGVGGGAQALLERQTGWEIAKAGRTDLCTAIELLLFFKGAELQI